jgi:cytochrome c5
MRLKTLVLAGATLATMTTGFGVSTLAVTASATTQTVAGSQVAGQGGDKGDDVFGFTSESPVCSALGAETIPTETDDVAKCLVGTQLV